MSIYHNADDFGLYHRSERKKLHTHIALSVCAYVSVHDYLQITHTFVLVCACV